MKTISKFIAGALARLLLLLFVLLTGDSYALDVYIANDSSTHDLRVVIYPYNPDTLSITTPGIQVFASPHQRVQCLSVNTSKAYVLFQYSLASSESWVTNASMGADPLLDVNAGTVMTYEWSSGSPGQSLIQNEVSQSGGGVLTSDEMETFKLGFWFVVSCGLFIVILGVARMISQQDHRP